MNKYDWMQEDEQKTRGLVIILSVLIVICVALHIFKAHMEAEIFNRMSVTKITWFDALWADFRILPD